MTELTKPTTIAFESHADIMQVISELTAFAYTIAHKIKLTDSYNYSSFLSAFNGMKYTPAEYSYTEHMNTTYFTTAAKPSNDVFLLLRDSINGAVQKYLLSSYKSITRMGETDTTKDIECTNTWCSEVKDLIVDYIVRNVFRLWLENKYKLATTDDEKNKINYEYENLINQLSAEYANILQMYYKMFKYQVAQHTTGIYDNWINNSYRLHNIGKKVEKYTGLNKSKIKTALGAAALAGTAYMGAKYGLPGNTALTAAAIAGVNQYVPNAMDAINTAKQHFGWAGGKRQRSYRQRRRNYRRQTYRKYRR